MPKKLLERPLLPSKLSVAGLSPWRRPCPEVFASADTAPQVHLLSRVSAKEALLGCPPTMWPQRGEPEGGAPHSGQPFEVTWLARPRGS